MKIYLPSTFIRTYVKKRRVSHDEALFGELCWQRERLALSHNTKGSSRMFRDRGKTVEGTCRGKSSRFVQSASSKRLVDISRLSLRLSGLTRSAISAAPLGSDPSWVTCLDGGRTRRRNMMALGIKSLCEPSRSSFGNNLEHLEVVGGYLGLLKPFGFDFPVWIHITSAP